MGPSGERGPSALWVCRVVVALAAGPSCQLGAVFRVGELGALGVGGQVQHPDGLVVIKDVQGRVLEAGCLGQLGEHARRHWPAAERLPVRMPFFDSGMQLDLGVRRAVRPGQPDRGQQQRLRPDRGAAGHPRPAGGRGGQAEVEQRGAAGDVRRPAVRIAVGQLPGRVGAQLDGAGRRH